MDEEDLIESQKKFSISKVYDHRFKIDFMGVFISCIVLMIMDETIKYLNYLPELFNGADYIFHIFQSVITICSQLGVSIAAAVIFYYILEFINAKKKINDITEIRKYMLFILYNHMNIICNTKSFEDLNRDKKRLKGDVKLFLFMDIPILLECYNDCNKEKFAKELNDYFLEVHKDIDKKRILIIELQGFQKDITSLLEYKRFSFYKGYMEDIEGLQSVYEEVDGYSEIYKSEDNIECFKFIIDNYLSFLEDCIHIYHIMERYVECLEDKHFIEFMKMMD